MGEEEKVEEFLCEFQKLLDTCDVVTMSGSAPKGVGADIYARMIRMGNNLSES